MAMGPDGPTGYVTSKPTVRRLFIQPILLRSVGVRIAEQWRGIELVSYASTDAPAPVTVGACSMTPTSLLRRCAGLT